MNPFSSPHLPERPRLLFTCGREPGYNRNAVLRQALEACFDLVSITDSSRWLLLRYLRLSWGLLRLHSTVQAALVGFYGQPLMLLAPGLIRAPVVFDAYLSTYETLCLERKTFSPTSPLGKLAFWLDRASCARAERILLDTQANVEYFHRLYGVPREKMQRLFVGCNELLYFPRPALQPVPGRVVFWGSFIPLQGTDVIVKAAKLLEDAPAIHFHLLGKGMQLDRVQALARELGLKNVRFLPFRPESELPDEIAQAAVCLTGQFGDFDKSRRVIATKTFQAMAMGKAPVVGEGPGNHELLTPGQDAVFVPLNDARSLAEAIRSLVSNPVEAARLGQNARQTFLDRASTPVLAAQLSRLISDMLAPAGNGG